MKRAKAAMNAAATLPDMQTLRMYRGPLVDARETVALSDARKYLTAREKLRAFLTAHNLSDKPDAMRAYAAALNITEGPVTLSELNKTYESERGMLRAEDAAKIRARENKQARAQIINRQSVETALREFVRAHNGALPRDLDVVRVAGKDYLCATVNEWLRERKVAGLEKRRIRRLVDLASGLDL